MDFPQKDVNRATVTQVDQRALSATNLVNVHVMTMLKVDAAIVVKKINTIDMLDVWTVNPAIT
jgi:hypothetical protein